MNLDHVFIAVDSDGKRITSVSAVRTDRKGKVLAASDADSVVIAARTVIEPFSDTYLIISQYPTIKILSTDKTAKSCGLSDKEWLDIAQVAWPLAFSDMVGNCNLDTLCKHFGINYQDAGTTIGDCEAMVRVYWAMMTRYRTALIAEEGIRDYGGEALRGIRKFIGF